MSPLEGVLPLDKPPGPSSHDMVAIARLALGIRRIGHTGTLDPFASGLLLLCLGRATRLVEFLHDLPKEYVATALLGQATTTDDIEGTATSVSEAWRELQASDVTEALAGFTGEIQQVPPTYSAKKIRGTAAYKRARRGEGVELIPIAVTIHSLELEELELPKVRFRVRCSTGTYIRAIARDLGEQLECGAHLTRLRRTAIGPFRVEDALGPEALDGKAEVEGAVVSPLDSVRHLPLVEVSADQAVLLETGQPVALDPGLNGPVDQPHAVAVGGRLVAVAYRDVDRLRPRKVFPREDAHA